MSGALCRSLWVELYDLAYGKSFVLRHMAGVCVAAYGWSFMIWLMARALCCGIWLEFVSQLMGGACVAAYGLSFVLQLMSGAL